MDVLSCRNNLETTHSIVWRLHAAMVRVVPRPADVLGAKRKLFDASAHFMIDMPFLVFVVNKSVPCSLVANFPVTICNVQYGSSLSYSGVVEADVSAAAIGRRA